MKLTWLGHSGFRLETGDKVILIDPWLSGNPVLPEEKHEAATAGATHILLSHAHFDHSGDVLALARKSKVPLVGQFDLMSYWAETEGVETTGFNKGGTVSIGDVQVTLVHAVHSSSNPEGGYAGGEAGFMISGEGHTIYFSGDTDVMADMKVFNDLHAPDIGLLCCGGFYTMDMRRAAYAAKTFFDFKTLIPCHYRTFPVLAQSAQELIDALPDVNVVEPEVLKPIEL